MTKQEMLQKYNVPPDLFDKYEAAHKCTGFTDKDVENMSLILTLYDAGFDDAEVRDYIGFYRSGGDTAEKRTEMLLKKRKKRWKSFMPNKNSSTESIICGIKSRKKTKDRKGVFTMNTTETKNSKQSKALVAYFSASGVTKRYAERLAKAAGADLFEIKPRIPYTSADSNWQNAQSRSSVEMKNPDSRPEIAEKLPHMEHYDTIFVGFPIWWYVAPTIIDTFLESYDFSGKTVIPFATSGGSGMGKTALVLRKVCPAADIKDGKVLNGLSDEQIARWAKEF